MEAGTGPPHHRADGGQESRSIATCEKDILLEMMTSWNERCSSPPDPSPAKAGHAERVIRCCLCTKKGVSGIQREMNQLTEVAVRCPHQSRCCETGNRTAPSRGVPQRLAKQAFPKPAPWGQPGLCRGRADLSPPSWGHKAPRAPLSPPGHKAERRAGRHGGRGSCSL